MRELGATLLILVASVALASALGAAYTEWAVVLIALAIPFVALGVFLLTNLASCHAACHDRKHRDPEWARERWRWLYRS